MTQDANNPAIMIELDSFVSPDAANDVPSDDDSFARMLEIDPMPVALAPSEVAETPVVDAQPVTVDAPDLSAIVAESQANAASGPSGRFGSIRSMDQVVNTSALPGQDLPVSQNPTIVDARVNGQIPVFNRANRAQRVAATPTETPDTVILAPVNAAIETDERLCGIELAWNPATREGHEIPRATVCALLDASGLSTYHPPIPMPKGLFGQVFKSLNNAESREQRDDSDRLLARCVTRADFTDTLWPDNLVSRYVVGRIDSTIELGSLGSKDLVCSLVKVDGGFECQFAGGNAAMRQAITERFDALQGQSMLNVTSLLKWYTTVLETKFNAVRDGFAMLIVDDGTDVARERIATAEKLATVLQGSDLYGPSLVMGRRLKIKRVVSRSGLSTREFHLAVGAGLLNDVREHGKVFAKALTDAQEFARTQESNRHDATPESIELAVRRAQIGSDRANSKAIGLLATLRALQARATAMVEVIGEHARPAINACEALRQEYAPKCKGIDATSERYANIELD